MASESSEPERARSDAPAETLDAGLRNAFGPDPIAPARGSESVLLALKRIAGPIAPGLLRSIEGRASAPVPPDSRDLFPGREGPARYRLLGEIARGGMGEVFRCWDQDLGRDVAVKFLGEQHRHNPSMARRFVEEAQIGGQLQHPGIVPVHDIGLTADERPYFTMRLVEGETLASLLGARQDPGEDRRRFLVLFEKVLETMAYAHARGVIHRDLKPQNIMVGPFGDVQVMDWGLSKVLGNESPGEESHRGGSSADRPVPVQATGSRSESGSVMGTPAYMPPEQARGEVDRLDERSDVFSLGAILCEILTGEPPYEGETPRAIRAKAASAQLDPARRRLKSSQSDGELVRIAFKCLAPTQSSRYAHAGEAANELSGYLASVDDRARRAEIDAAEARVKVAEERRARRLTVGLAAAVVLAILIAGGAYLWMEADRRGRTTRAMRAVTQAMQEAGALRERAASAGAPDVGLLAQARAAAERAVVVARESGLDPETRAWTEQTRHELAAAEKQARAAAEQAAREQQMVARLEAIRAQAADVWLDKGDFEAVVDNDYARAFKDQGIDVDALPPEDAARRIRATGIPLALVAALDDWVGVRKRRAERARRLPDAAADTPKAPDWKRLFAMAQAADPDPVRARVREAVFANDLPRLRELSGHADMDSWPIQTLQLLWNSLGTAGDVERAVLFLTEVQRIHPRDFWVQYDLGLWLGRMKPRRSEEAARCFATAVALRPTSAAAWTNLGVALMQRRDLEGAFRAQREALRLNPQSPAPHQNLGNVLVELGRPAEAVEELREALRIQSDHTSSHAALANALRADGKLEEALASMRDALARDPERADIRYLHGRVLEDLGKLDEAQAAYRKAIELDGYLADAHVHLGLTLKKSGKPDEALAEYEKALRMDPDHPVAHLNLGVVFADRGDLDQAAMEFRRSILARPDYVQAHNNLGALLARRGDLPGAIASFRRALEIDPDNLKALAFLGRALSESGKPREALEPLEKALRIRADHFEVLTSLGAIWADQLVDREKGVAYVKKAASVRPQSSLARFNLGTAFAQDGRYAEAITELKAAIDLDPKSIDALRYLGNCHELLKDWPAAAKAFRAALKLRPDLPEVQKSLATVLRAMGDRAGAIRAFEAAIKLEPNDVDVRVQLGALLVEEREWNRAIAVCRAAVKIDPRSIDAWFNQGIALINAGCRSEAVDAFRKAVELRPREAQVRKAYGVALGYTGQPIAAMREFKAALELGHGDKEVEAQLDEFRPFAVLEQNLPAILTGKEDVKEPESLVRLAKLCGWKNLTGAAARFWQRALAADPKLGADQGNRYNAACAAARAGSGKGEDASSLTAEDRSRWRMQAVSWLKMNLATMKQRLEKGTDEERKGVAEALRHWLRYPDLTGIRESECLALLSARESNAYSALWFDITSLLSKNRQPVKSASFNSE